jgi:hypothetical protein
MTPSGGTTSSAGTTSTTSGGGIVTSAGTSVTSTGGQVSGTTTESAVATAAGPNSTIAATTSGTDFAAEVRIYVETNGNDSATGATTTVGSSDGPVLTIARAQQIARAKLAAMLTGSTPRLPVRVLLGPGTYRLGSTQVFNSTDSGTSTAPVSYEARELGTVTISGGVSLGAKVAPSTATTLSSPRRPTRP